ncbi:MAG: 7-cyano-7-deazaguanine synthase QueC [bacterium]
MKKAVILLSGGLDSATTLAIASHEGYECYALTFSYGQRHRFELESAKKVAQSLGVVEHKVLSIDLASFGGSALTDSIEVPKQRTEREISTEIPVTYVPARNTIFLSFALAFVEVIQAEDIFIGVNAIDYSGYPDCRPEYISAFQQMANLATKAAVEGTMKLTIHTPLLRLSKAEIIRAGRNLGVDYSLTSSCYDPSEHGDPCGLCDACMLRKKGFATAGMTDPLNYRVTGV